MAFLQPAEVQVVIEMYDARNHRWYSDIILTGNVRVSIDRTAKEMVEMLQAWENQTYATTEIV